MNATGSTRSTQRWIDDFVVALRARDVPGARIGDLVAEVESHLAESGEAPDEAFGSPSAYAARRCAEVRDAVPLTGSQWAATLAPAVAGVVGLVLLLPSVTALKEHTRVGISWGQLAALVVLGVTCAALVRRLEPLLLRRALGMTVLGAAFVAMVALPVVLGATAFTLPAVVGLVAAVALLALSVVGQTTWARAEADPVVDPVSGDDRYARRGVASGAGGSAIGAQAWSLPLVAVVLAAIAWFA